MKELEKQSQKERTGMKGMAAGSGRGSGTCTHEVTLAHTLVVD